MPTKASREGQVALGATALYVATSFLDWEPFSAPGGRVVFLAGLLATMFLGWEAARAFEVRFAVGSEIPDVISVSLALSLVLFSLGALLSRTDRPWPEWLAVLLSAVIAAASVLRGSQAPRETQNDGSGARAG